jgi:cytosine/adenosine deaminase-related metal-dependent hydrolase
MTVDPELGDVVDGDVLVSDGVIVGVRTNLSACR